MNLVIKGKLLKILPVESGVGRNGNPWKKREFVVDIQDQQYPRKICFTLFNDRLSLVEGFREGENVEVTFDVESREYNGKWYHTLSAWKVETQVPKTAGAGYPPLTEDEIPPENAGQESGDLPF